MEFDSHTEYATPLASVAVVEEQTFVPPVRAGPVQLTVPELDEELTLELEDFAELEIVEVALEDFAELEIVEVALEDLPELEVVEVALEDLPELEVVVVELEGVPELEVVETELDCPPEVDVEPELDEVPPEVDVVPALEDESEPPPEPELSPQEYVPDARRAMTAGRIRRE